jgi:hypothetical protein
MAGLHLWLDKWRREGTDPAAALATFDQLDGVTVEAILGRWRGVSLPTGHSLDGLLDGLGWYGKAFESPDRVHPLLFRTVSGAIVPLDPPRLLVGLGLRVPRIGRQDSVRRAFRVGLPILRTHSYAARLEQRTFRGVSSVAMVYRRLPIVDHFRRIDADRMLGLMVVDQSRKPFFFFLLCRDAPSRRRPSGAV